MLNLATNIVQSSIAVFVIAFLCFGARDSFGASCPDAIADVAVQAIDAECLLRHAERESEFISDPSQRATILAYIAWGHLEAGRPDQIQGLVNRILKLCSIASESFDCHNYAAWASAAGGQTALAREEAKSSNRILSKVAITPDTVLAFADLAFAQAEAGLLEPVEAMHHRVAEAATHYPDPLTRAFALSYLGYNWTMFRNPSWSSEAIDGAETALAHVHGPDSRIPWVLISWQLRKPGLAIPALP